MEESETVNESKKPQLMTEEPLVQVDLDLVEWLKSKISLAEFEASMWNEACSSAAAEFFANRSLTRLIIYVEEKNRGEPVLKLDFHRVPQLGDKKVRKMQYFLKAEVDITLETVDRLCQYGTISGDALDSLLHLMHGMFLPTFLSNSSWPESVRKEFSGELHKFMANLTQTTFELKGSTVLYMPKENYQNTELAARDKDLVHRLELVLLNWDGQIKKVVANQDTGQNDNAGPLEEIAFWEARTKDLSGIRLQLEQSGVQGIVKVLETANRQNQSPNDFLVEFLSNSMTIEHGSIQAKDNLLFLSMLKDPCSRLSNASPAEIPPLLPPILNIIRMIWTCSSYYNTNERITGLLRKVSTQIINQCTKQINLKEIFEGDIKRSMQVLRESIECSRAWKVVFDKTKRAIDLDTKTPNKWSFDSAAYGIFAQIDAFSGRCLNLVEVCEGQMQFARRHLIDVKNGRDQLAPLPVFGGTRGGEIEKSLYEIEDSFKKHLDDLQSRPYDILNVKATTSVWLHDYNIFKTGLKEVEVMLIDVIDTHWQDISTIQAGVEFLEAFFHLSIRKELKQSIGKKTSALYQLFITEITNVYKVWQTSPFLSPGHPKYAGRALWARSLIDRLKANEKILKEAYWLPVVPETELAFTTLKENMTPIINFINNAHKEWEDYVGNSTPEKWNDTLSNKLMKKSDDKGAEAKSGDAGDKDGKVQSKNATFIESEFEKSLLRLFAEVRYWHKFNGEKHVPTHASEMYGQQNLQLRTLRESVMLVVRDYNTIIDALDKEERKLFQKHLDQVDKELEPGIRKLNWDLKKQDNRNDDGPKYFIGLCRLKCQEVYGIVTSFKDNDKKISRCCKTMESCLFLDIEKNVAYTYKDFEARQAGHFEKCVKILTQARNEIIDALTASYTFFHDHPKDVQKEWGKYVRKVDQRIEKALRTTVKKSFTEFSKAIRGDKKSKSEPDPLPRTLFKINMILDESVPAQAKPDFSPNLTTLGNSIKSTCLNIMSVVKVVPRCELTMGLSKADPEVKFSSDNNTNEEKAIPKVEEKQKDEPMKSTIKAAEPKARVTGGKGKDTKGKTAEAKTKTTTAISSPRTKAAVNVEKKEKKVTKKRDGDSKESKDFHTVIVHDQDIINLFNLIIMACNTDHITPSETSKQLEEAIANFKDFAQYYTPDKAKHAHRLNLPQNKKKSIMAYEVDIKQYKEAIIDVQKKQAMIPVRFIRVDCTMIKQSITNHCLQLTNIVTTLIHNNATTELNALTELMHESTVKMKRVPETLAQLKAATDLINKVKSDIPATEARFPVVEETYKCLTRNDKAFSDDEKQTLENLRGNWESFLEVLQASEAVISTKKEEMKAELKSGMKVYSEHVISTRKEFQEKGPFSAPGPDEGEANIDGAWQTINEFRQRLQENRAKAQIFATGIELFELPNPDYRDNDDLEKELDMLGNVWQMYQDWLNLYDTWKACKFSLLDIKQMTDTSNEYLKNLRGMSRIIKSWKVWKALLAIVQRFQNTMPLISNLRSNAMRPRHWIELQAEIPTPFDPASDSFTLEKLIQVNIHLHSEFITGLASRANRQLVIENKLRDIAAFWKDQKFDMVPYKNKYWRIRDVTDINDQLENDQMTLGQFKNSPYFLTFAKDINYWSQATNEIVETVDMLITVQRQWMYLENIFMESADIKKQMPSQATLFETVNNTWIEIMNKLAESQLVTGVLQEGLLNKLGRMNNTLEKINHHLDRYLENKRTLFPRFYFLSNDDLLEILGHARDPVYVQRHIRKFFVGLSKMVLVEKKGSPWEIVGISSPDGEEVKLHQTVLVENEVEHWLSELEMSVKETLQKLLISCIAFVQSGQVMKNAVKLKQWVKSNAGQLVILSGQVMWTESCTKALSKDPGRVKRYLRKLKSSWTDYLVKLAKYIKGDKGDTTPQEFCKLEALITIEVHSRDVIADIRTQSKTKKLNVNSFDWTKQLRFYWEAKGEGICVAKQTNTRFEYGYEYQGNNGRLVVTPLTDRCYLTLTTALNLALGGSPAGPAGTGKTETVKDLAKALGKLCFVFNCSPEDKVYSIGRNFSGLCQSGAWGCFDEFNRILIEVLSVVALQVSSIMTAVREKADKFNFQGTVIRLQLSVGVFITMNPGYAGRTELPDNLKSLFRPVAMMAPDTTMIAEVSLLSKGFNAKKAKELAKNVITIYELMFQQLSKQSHYSYGLRAITSVLNRSGAISRDPTAKNLSEELIIMRALNDMILSTLLQEDVFLFTNILSDVFPGQELPAADYTKLNASILADMKANNLQVTPMLLTKIFQLYETLNTRHGMMLVGPTCAGKSTAWKILSRSLTALNEQKVPGFESVQIDCLNPKSISTDELYGCYSAATKEWTDGILSNIMRKACSDEGKHWKWIMLDGPVDTLWIESMNTVLDDNKILTLINSDRIALNPTVRMMFEVLDLDVASPATVSRCGMLYMDSKVVGWRNYVASWISAKAVAVGSVVSSSIETKSGEIESGAVAPMQWTPDKIEVLRSLFEKYIPKLLAARAEMQKSPSTRDLVVITDFEAVKSLCNLFDALIAQYSFAPAAEGDVSNPNRALETWFCFCVTWSLGGPCTEKGRKVFDAAFRDVEAGNFPPTQLSYDYYVDAKREFSPWQDKVPNAWKPTPGVPYHKLLVPTVDTVRYSFILSALLEAKKPALITGATGTGKTAIIVNVMDNMSKKYLPLVMNFSAATSAKSCQELIESRLAKRQRTNWGPVGGKARLVVFVDDLNMPTKEEFGAQPAIELLKEWVDYGFVYDREKQFKKFILDTQIMAAMGPPGGARSILTACFRSRMNLLTFTFPHDSQVQHIFKRLTDDHFALFDDTIKALGPNFTQATLQIFVDVGKTFFPTPAKCHYLFNLRDISKVFQGMLQSRVGSYDNRDSMIRLWIHEIMRVFYDRLINDEDRVSFIEMIHSKLGSVFESKWEKLFGEKDVMPRFADLFESDKPPTTDAKDDGTNPYAEITKDSKRVVNFLKERLESYNNEPEAVQVDLVLFDYAVDHVLRIYRILKQDRGNAMLVGVGGSGRQSLTRLASFIAGYRVKSISSSKGSKEAVMKGFREELKGFYRSAGVQYEHTVFLISDTQLVYEAFLEDINNILNSGEIPGLFPPDELEPIFDELRHAAGEDTFGSADELYTFFIGRVRDRLHIVLAMSPVGADFRNRVRMFPALVNCCTIDWFAKWPEDALRDVALKFLSTVEVGDEKRKPYLAELFCSAHMETEKMSVQLLHESKRYNYITPTKFLDLVKAYTRLLGAKRKKIDFEAEKLRNGLDKLQSGADNVTTMSITLEVDKGNIKIKKMASEKKAQDIEVKKQAAEVKKKEVGLQKAKTEEETKKTARLAYECKIDLEKAAPAEEKASAAIQALERNKKGIDEVKNYKSPPALVQLVLECVMIALGKDPSWHSAKKEIMDPNFLKSLIHYDKRNIPDKLIKVIRSYTSRENFNQHSVHTSSPAAACLVAWVEAIELYAKIWKEVKPKKDLLDEKEAELREKQRALDEAESELKKVVDEVDELDRKAFEEAQELRRLETNLKLLESRLEKAVGLISSLSGERKSWQQSLEGYSEELRLLVGDCTTSASFFAYAGPFATNYREILVSKWTQNLRRVGVSAAIPFNVNFDFKSFNVSPTDVMSWNLQNLPSDDFSTENGILVTRGNRWPLMIDPQGQANLWIKDMEGFDKQNLTVVDFQTKNFLNKITGCLQQGRPVLIQDILEEIDASLSALLSMDNFNRPPSIVLNSSEYSVDPAFRMYFTTKLPNPHYMPDIASKTTVVNFSVVEKGLQDQLLAVVVKFEQPKREIEKANLLKTVASGQLKKRELEDGILSSLQKAGDKSLVDNDELIEQLRVSKITKNEINESLKVSEEISKKIDVARESYRPVAIRAALCFFTLLDLSSIDPMYQFSLKGYIELFQSSLSRSKDRKRESNSTDDREIQRRIIEINDFHTYAMYTYACRGLFERHKLLFSFVLCIAKLKSEKAIDETEYNFFLRGGTVLDRALRPANPVPEWLPEVCWDHISELDKLDDFRGVAHSFDTNGPEWKAFFTADAPDKMALPGDWNQRRNVFPLMVVLRCVRMDRVVFASRVFISGGLGPQYTESPDFDLKSTFIANENSNVFLFVLSPGVDPSISVLLRVFL